MALLKSSHPQKSRLETMASPETTDSSDSFDHGTPVGNAGVKKSILIDAERGMDFLTLVASMSLETSGDFSFIAQLVVEM